MHYARAFGPAVLLLAALPLLADGQTKVSVQATDGNVRDIVLTLARTAGVEVQLRPEVRGPITVDIREMPFEQALTVVAGTAGFRWRKIDGVYHVGRFSDAGGDRPRRETIALGRCDAFALARAFGYCDLTCLDQAAPALDLRRLLPPGLDGAPAPTADGRGLEVAGTAAAVADLKYLIASLEKGGALITYECYAAYATPAALDALPVAWAKGEMQFGASPGRQVRSSSGDYRVLLDRLRRGIDGIAALAQPTAAAGELATATPSDAAAGVTVRLIGRLENALTLRLWMKATVAAPGGEVELMLDGALLPPEEGFVLVSEPLPGERGSGPVLLVMMPRVDVIE